MNLKCLFFCYKNQEWETFAGKFKYFVKLNNFSAKNWCAVLLTLFSLKSEVDKISWSELLWVLGKHFQPKSPRLPAEQNSMKLFLPSAKVSGIGGGPERIGSLLLFRH